MQREDREQRHIEGARRARCARCRRRERRAAPGRRYAKDSSDSRNTSAPVHRKSFATGAIIGTLKPPRFAITGIGVVSAFGVGREVFWDSIRRGQSGTRAITEFDVSTYPCQVAAPVPPLDISSAMPLDGELSARDAKADPEALLPRGAVRRGRGARSLERRRAVVRRAQGRRDHRQRRRRHRHRRKAVSGFLPEQRQERRRRTRSPSASAAWCRARSRSRLGCAASAT